MLLLMAHCDCIRDGSVEIDLSPYQSRYWHSRPGHPGSMSSLTMVDGPSKGRKQRFLQAPSKGDSLVMFDALEFWQNRLPSYDEVTDEMTACFLVGKDQDKDTKLACLDPKIVHESKRNWATSPFFPDGRR